MTSLVQLTIDAHGGLDRWRQFEHASAHLRNDGGLWPLKHQQGVLGNVDVRVARTRKGETEQRLFAVPVWRETPFFSPRERAALAWTRAVTDIGRGGVSDALYHDARAQFPEKQLVDLTLAVIAIHAWNRLAVTFRPAVGSYKPAAATAASP